MNGSSKDVTKVDPLLIGQVFMEIKGGGAFWRIDR